MTESLIEFPSIENFVSSSKIKIKGNNIGNDKTGYKVPFEPAFEIIAAIIVDAAAIPKFPSIKAKRNKPRFLIINESNKMEYKRKITIFIAKTRIKLKRSFPENTVPGEAINCNVNVVPRSSSETKARESPDIAEKKITTQSNPPARYSDIFSVPIEKRITLIVTRINIANALIA